MAINIIDTKLTRLNSELHPFWIDDLEEVFVWIFARRNLVGGMMGARDLRFFDKSDWIVQARYLLSIATSEHVETLMLVRSLYPELLSYPEYAFMGAAAWMAGLLKYRRFIEPIGCLSAAGGKRWYTCAFYASLLLFDDQSVADFYHQILRQRPDNDSAPMAFYCLKLMDDRYGSSHANNYPGQECTEKHKMLIDNLLRVSSILRAGIEFEHAEDLQPQLTQLLYDTVTIGQFQRGVLYHKPIRRVRIELSEWKQMYMELRGAAKAGNITDQTELIEMGKRILRVALGDEEQPAFLPVIDSKLSAVGWSFLMADSDSNRKAALDALNAVATTAENFVDILRLIELNAVHQYRIPAAIIGKCFERLLGLMAPSYDVYERYALAMLLSGNDNDENAKGLWELAQAITAKYQWRDDQEFGRHAMVVGGGIHHYTVPEDHKSAYTGTSRSTSMHYLEPYVGLIDQFLRNDLAIAAFERQYLDMFKTESKHFPVDEFEALNDLFCSVDAYCGDPTLRDSRDIDEDELRRRAALALSLLTRFKETTSK